MLFRCPPPTQKHYTQNYNTTAHSIAPSRNKKRTKTLFPLAHFKINSFLSNWKLSAGVKREGNVPSQKVKRISLITLVMAFETYLKGVCWRSVLTLRNLANFGNIQDLATIDVLRDIDYPSCAFLVHYARTLLCAHMRTLNYVAQECILYSAWASRCRF